MVVNLHTLLLKLQYVAAPPLNRQCRISGYIYIQIYRLQEHAGFVHEAPVSTEKLWNGKTC
jgi:hypothetical protein